jgi:hypothetical protein
MNKSIRLARCMLACILAVSSRFLKGLNHFACRIIGHRVPVRARPPAHSFNIPRLLLTFMENAGEPCISPEKHQYRKAIHGLGCTTAVLQQHHRYSYNLDATRSFSTRDERPSCRFDIHGVWIIPRSLLFGPTISSRRKLRHESPRERLFARRSRNSRRFSAFVQHSWPKLDSIAIVARLWSSDRDKLDVSARTG